MNPKQRYKSLVDIYRLMVFHGSYCGVELDPRILRACVESYSEDVRIHKLRNPGTGNIDPHKKAAFTIKWIVRFRPLQLIQSDFTSAPYKLVINEFYALFSGLSFMNIHVETISADYMRNFIYNLRRSPIEAEMLASEMYLLEQCVKGNSP